MLKCSEFAQFALGLELWPKQQQIVDEYFGGTITHGVWALGRRCVTGDTLVATSKGLIEIGSLKGQGELVDIDPGHTWRRCDLSLAQPNGSLCSAPFFYEGGMQDVYEVKTRFGYRIKGTKNHPIRILNEDGDLVWRDIRDLKENDYIALAINNKAQWPSSYVDVSEIAKRWKAKQELSPKAKSIQLPHCIDEGFGYALGLLVGDGSWTQKNGIQVTCHKDDADSFLESLERGFGIQVNTTGDKRNENIRYLEYHSIYFRQFLNDLGYTMDSKRNGKRVPWVIMQSPESVVCSFLSGFFDTDGCAESNGRVITFSTASVELAYDLQALLGRLGIICKISSKAIGDGMYWLGTLIGLKARQRFASLIGFRLSRKQKPVIDSLNVARDGGDSQAIPFQKERLRRIVADYSQKHQGISTFLRKIIGNSIKNCGEQFNARRLEKLLPFLESLESTESPRSDDVRTLAEFAKEEFVFDRIVSIQDAGREEVFDFHVSATNAFIGNNIYQHNSGKTLMSAIAALYVCFVLESYYKKRVRKNEKWYVVTVANDQQQAKIALNNIRQLLIDSRFAQEIIRETATDIEISNGCVFQAIPASARASRGKAVVMCIMDELAFSIEGDANRGARAIYQALSPSIAQFKEHGRILELSSPWLTDGLFYEHFCEAQSGDYKFMQPVNIPTWEINPNLPFDCDFLKAALARDPDMFWVEYGAQFSKNLSALVAPELVDAAVDKHRSILLPQKELHGMYYLALDPAKGGVGRDKYTSAIVHYEGPTLVVDKLHAFEPDFEVNGKKEVSIKVVEQWIKEHHDAYGFKSIVLDQFNSAATIQNLLENYPISELTWSVSTKMKAFSKFRQLLNAGLISLYPHEQAIKQIKGLSVIYRQSGQWTVTGGKESNVDDYPFAIAAAILEASESDDIDWINSLSR